MYVASTSSFYSSKELPMIKEAQCNVIADTKAHGSKPWNISQVIDDNLQKYDHLEKRPLLFEMEYFIAMS